MHGHEHWLACVKGEGDRVGWTPDEEWRGEQEVLAAWVRPDR